MRDIDARTLTPGKKRNILERDGYVCGYCLGEGDSVDHIVPWSYRHDDSEENLITACWLCNLIASNKMFRTFKAKREYIINRREIWLKKRPLSLWVRYEVLELGPEMQREIERCCIIVENIDEVLPLYKKLVNFGFKVMLGKKLRKILFSSKEIYGNIEV